jgi:hypothetical protein
MELLAVLSLAGFLWFVAVTPKEAMNMAWLLMVAAILLSPILAYFLPVFR